MDAETPLSPAELEAIREFDTCQIANAIEKFGLRLRNEGYTTPGLRCVTGVARPAIGYAVTSRVRTSDPPIVGHSYYDRTDWWKRIEKTSAPRLAVIEDADDSPGIGSSVGEVHASILRALRCEAVITNGAVRDLPALTAMGFPCYACHVTVSHSYSHMLDFDQPVEILGLHVEPGDLLIADDHGVLSVPPEIARELPKVAAEIARRERRIVDLCASDPFSLEKLRNTIREIEKR